MIWSIGHNEVVVKVFNDGQVKCALAGFDVADICDPFLVRPGCLEISVQFVLIHMELLLTLVGGVLVFESGRAGHTYASDGAPPCD